MKKLCHLMLFGLATKLIFANPIIYALHINGINTSRLAARQNLLALEYVANIKASTSLLKWDVIYNPTDTSDDQLQYLTNLEDVIIQKTGEALQMNIDDAIKLYMLVNGLNYATGSAEYNALVPTIAENIEEHFLGKNFDTIVNEFHDQVPPELSSVLERLAGHDTKDYGKFNNYVLLIPHSQGNLYANELYDYLVTKENYNIRQIQIFGIATPNALLKGSEVLSTYQQYEHNTEINGAFEFPIYSYITNSLDFVINALRVSTNITQNILREPLPSDITIAPTINDPTGHSLSETYLADSDSSHQIAKSINYIVSFFINMMNPANEDKMFPKAQMDVEIIKEKGDSLVNQNDQYVCNNGRCPINDGYYLSNQYTQKMMYLGYYFFNNNSGYKVLEDDNTPGRAMYINFAPPHEFKNYDWITKSSDLDCEEMTDQFQHTICTITRTAANFQYFYTYSSGNNNGATDICQAIITYKKTEHMVDGKCIIGEF